MSDFNQAQLFQEYQYAVATNYTLVAVTCLLFYDTAIAFSQEYQVVWSRRVTGASAIYIALRYSNLITAVMTLALLAVPSCSTLYILYSVLTGALCLVYLSQSAFAAIRVYAIQGGAWMTAVIVMALGLVPVATNIYGASQTTPADTLSFCESSKISATEYKKLFLATRACVVISEFIVLVAAWCASHSLKRLVSTGRSDRISLISLLFRDGIIHFAVVLGMNVAGIVYFVLQDSGTISTQIQLISSVILCRFFLNLRQAANSNDDLMTSSDRSFSGITSRIIGNMGEMLEEDSLESDTLVGTYCGTELDDEGDLLPSDNTREVDVTYQLSQRTLLIPLTHSE